MHGHEDQNSIAYRCEAYRKMRDVGRWDLLRDLLGGTTAMHRAGAKWLSPEKGEEVEQYETRLRRSHLDPAFAEAVSKIVGKPFSVEVDVKGRYPDSLEPVAENADGLGTSLTSFTADVFRSALVYGLSHVLVDWPPVPEGATLAEEQELGARPYFTHVEAPALINWRSEVIGGQRVLTFIAIAETAVVPKGPFGEREVERIRAFTRDWWQLWERIDDDEATVAKLSEAARWRVVEEGPNKLGEVPLRTVYFNQTGFLTGLPPLLGLAELNLAHWRRSSDLENIVHHVQVPLLLLAGFDRKLVDGGLTLSAGRFLAASDPAAKAGYVEHSGAAVETGMKHLRGLEERMRSLSMQPFMPGTGDIKATAYAIDEAQSQSAVKRWIVVAQGFLEECYHLGARWTGAHESGFDEQFAVDIFEDFTIGAFSERDGALLIKLRAVGDISRQTLIEEMRRRNILNESVDPEEEAARLDAESPAGGFDASEGDAGTDGDVGDNTDDAGADDADSDAGRPARGAA